MEHLLWPDPLWFCRRAIIAKLLMPGRDPGGCIITILLGIGGSALFGWVARKLLSANWRAGRVGRSDWLGRSRLLIRLPAHLRRAAKLERRLGDWERGRKRERFSAPSLFSFSPVLLPSFFMAVLSVFRENTKSALNGPDVRSVYNPVERGAFSVSAETLQFKTELKQILNIIIHSLYSHKDIFHCAN